MSDEILPGVEDDSSPLPPEFDTSTNVEVGDGLYEGAEAGDAAESFDPALADAPIPVMHRTGRGGRRRGKNYYSDDPPGPTTRRPLPWEDRSLEWDAWCNAFPWGVDSTLRFVLKRLAPQRGPNGVDISGVLETRESTPILLEEIRHTYGGGEYEAAIVGVHPQAKDNRARTLSRRRTHFPGMPNTTDSGMPRGVLSSRGPTGDPIAKSAMDMMQAEFTSLRRRADESPRLVEKTIDTMQAVSEQRAKQAETSAAARIEMINQQLQDLRVRNLDLEKRLKDSESDMLKKAAENHEKLAATVSGIQTSSLDTIMQFIPMLSGKADDQVKQMASMYAAKEERLAAEYKSAVAQVQANFQSQMQAQQTLFHAQLETTKGQYEHIASMLQHELQTARTEIVALQRQVERLRDALDQKNQELLTKVLESRAGKGAMEQMTELGAMFEAMESMKSFFGGGQQGGDDLEGVENPVTRKLLKMGEGAVQHLPAILDAIKSRGGAQPGQPMTPQQAAELQQMQQVHAQQQAIAMRQAQQAHAQRQRQQPVRRPPVARHPAAAPAAPTESPPPSPTGQPVEPRVKKEDVEVALRFLENVLASGTPPSPADVAQTAMSQVDNAVLRAMAVRKPESVIEQLEAQGMLRGPLVEEAGKAYLQDLLVVLKEKLAPAAE